MDIIKYKGYEGTAELDMSRQVCRGKILFIDDLVTYESDSPSELQNEFKSAVEDYLDTCKTLGKKPQKPIKGQFNVRIPPTLHKSAALRAVQDNMKLNEVVVRALDYFLNARPEINHTVRVIVEGAEWSGNNIMVGQSEQPVWGRTAYVQ